MENIIPGAEKNFKKTKSSKHGYRGTRLDLESVMMYGPTAFGNLDSIGKRMITIEPQMPGVEFR